MDATGNWPWIIMFVPLWLVMAAAWFSVAAIPKRAAGPHICKLIDMGAVALSLASAGGIALFFKCGSSLNLAVSDPACHVAAVQLSAWFAS
jgi:hypothetical protein